MGKAWIVFVARRYLGGGTKKRGRSRFFSRFFAIGGIATGVCALLIILSVMNGFQLGFIESILEIASYHLRIVLPEDQATRDQLMSYLAQDSRIRSTTPFIEFQGLIKGNRRNPQVCVVRALDGTRTQQDKGFLKKLHIEEGSFDLSQPNSIILGAELARSLGVSVGDRLTLFWLVGDLGEEGNPAVHEFLVTGLFRCGYYQYDAAWGFIPYENGLSLVSSATRPVVGIKLTDPYREGEVLFSLKKLFPSLHSESWRDYNRAFFQALRTEKSLMFFLVALIFLVVGLNIFQSQRRALLERQEELALFQAIGASPRAIRMIFTFEGLLIGCGGALIGLFPGVLIAFNIGPFFTFLETVVNGVLKGLAWGISLFTAHPIEMGTFGIFSPQIFYLKTVPSRLLPLDILLILLFPIVVSTLAAFLASRKITTLRPAEVLRYE